MAPLSLSQLLDVAIGTPEVGAVNFRALHSLLQAMLEHLGLQDLPALEQGCSPTPLLGGDQPVEAHPGEEGRQGRGPGTGHGPLAARKDPLQGTVSGSQVTSVAADMGQMKKKIEEEESGVSKAMALSQDLLEEIGGMKAAQSRMGEDIRMIQEALGLENLQDAAGRLPSLHDQMTLDSDVKKLKERLSLYPAPEEVSNMVHWEVLEDCLVGRKAGGGGGGGGGRGLPVEGSGGQPAPAEPSTSDVDTPRWGSSAPGLKGPGTQPVPRTSKGTPGTQPGSLGMQAGMRRASATPEKWAGAPSDRTRTSAADVTTPGTQPGSPGTQTTIPGTQPGSPGTQTTIPGMQPGTPGTQTTTPGMQPGSPGTQTATPGMQPGSPGTQTATPGMQPGTPGTQTTTPGMQPGTPGTQTTIPRMQPAPPGTQEQGAGVQPNPSDMEPSLPGAKKVPTEATPGALGTQMDATSTQLDQAGHRAAGTLSLTAQGFEVPLNAGPRTTSPLQEPAVPWGSSGSSSASSRYVETVEALRQIGQLGNLYTALKEQVAHLEATKSDNAELEKLRLLFPEGDQESITNILADLRDQVSSLQGLASDLQGEKGKIRQLEDAFGKLGVTGADWKVDGSDQVTLQLGSTLQEIKQELKELREQQETTKATLEQLVTKTADQLQEQLDKLKAMVESTGQEQAEAQAEVQAEGQAACPICSTDIGVQVGQLLQRYEKLQELVDSFVSRQPVAKVVRQLPGRSQDEELLKRIQATVAQVQGDYKKLSSVTGNLLDDRRQKQKDIEALFQSLERLEKEKADKEDLLLGIDVKADKTTLAGKVSRTQFEACVERLNEMIQETLSRVTGQEQGWHQVQRQLTEEMDSKLDRLELGPFRQQLEEHWKSILEQLKEKAPTTEADDAAGIKKQLLAHFHCMSCDRPLSMLVPGPHIVAIPSMPPLPPRLARRPQTILELEQTQQHGHRERVAECAYPSVPRHCGGQHTLTHPLQRCPRLQSLPPGAPQLLQPPTLLPIKHDEMELLGQDGHIYRGQRDGQLPAFVGKEGSPRDKPKLSPRQWDPQGSGRLLSRPQSAGSSLSQPGTAASPEHRPASSSGRLSQESGLLPPLWTQRGGSSTPTARQDWESLAEPPPPQPPSRRASGSSQQQ